MKHYWDRPTLRAVFIALAVVLPTTAFAQDKSKSPVEATNLYLDAYLRTKPDAVQALGHYLDAGDSGIDWADIADVPQVLTDVIREALTADTSGPEKDRERSVEVVASAIHAALKRTSCRAIPGEADKQDDHSVAVPFVCSVPDTQAALAYAGDDVLKGGKVSPAQNFAAADAINAVTTMQKVLGTLHLHSEDGTAWISADLSEVGNTLVLGIMTPPAS